MTRDEPVPDEVRVDTGPSARTRLACAIADEPLVRVSELEEYVDVRYDHLQERIRAADPDYEGDLNVLSWKSQQDELVQLLRHFRGDSRD